MKKGSAKLKDKRFYENYLDIFLNENSKINLISKNDEKFLWEKHVYDSLAIEYFFEKYNPKISTLLDIGTGGGFPAIPIALTYPKLSVYALDSIKKKICAIEKINIGNITLENISSLIINPQKINFKKYQEIFTDNYKKINYCIGKGTIPYFPDGTKIINMNVIIKEKYDWTKFISCLKEQTSKLKDSLIQKLIEFIKEGNYYDALREEFKLRIKGNFIIKQCIAMKTKPLLSL